MKKNELVKDRLNAVDRDYPTPDLHQEIAREIRDGVVGTFREMFKEGGFDLWFPAYWQDSDGVGGGSQDGKTIYLSIYLDEGADPTVLRFNLLDMIREATDGDQIHSDNVPGLQTIRKGLQEGIGLIDELIASVQPGQKPE